MNASGHDIELSDTEFRRIVQIAACEAGIAIPDGKRSLVQSRVAKRIRRLGVASCKDYLASLNNEPGEVQNLISALTTNVSHFFREKHHFELLRDNVLRHAPAGKLRIWSAGCSKGQEPYSLAMEILKSVPDAARRDILVLASDIDRDILEKAKAATYTPSEIENVPQAERSRFFEHLDDGSYRVNDDVRHLVRFRALNLNAASWPMRGPFDAIFCRNVMIYFDAETQARLWPRFHTLLRQGGLLMLGHSERIHPLAGSGFTAAGVTTYRKI